MILAQMLWYAFQLSESLEMFTKLSELMYISVKTVQKDKMD